VDAGRPQSSNADRSACADGGISRKMGCLAQTRRQFLRTDGLGLRICGSGRAAERERLRGQGKWRRRAPLPRHPCIAKTIFALVGLSVPGTLPDPRQLRCGSARVTPVARVASFVRGGGGLRDSRPAIARKDTERGRTNAPGCVSSAGGAGETRASRGSVWALRSGRISASRGAGFGAARSEEHISRVFLQPPPSNLASWHEGWEGCSYHEGLL
jgi:hypothetical protein